MTYLGYDPTLLNVLRRAMTDAAVELELVRCADPDGQHAVHAMRALRDVITATWLPRLDAILRCSALSDYRPVGPASASSLADAHRLASVHRPGWSLTTDPAAPMRPLPAAVDRAAFVTALLRMPDRRFDDEDLRWLLSALTRITGADRDTLPTRRIPLAVFTAADASALLALVNRLGADRAALITDERVGGLSDGQRQRLATIDSIERRLAPSIDAATAAELSSVADPYAAARIVAAADLDDDMLATLTAQLLRREHDLAIDTDAYACGARVADTLFALVAGRSAASARLVALLADRPALLFESERQPVHVNDMVIHASRPGALTDDEQRRVIPALLAFVVDALERPVEPYSDHNADIEGVTGNVLAGHLLSLFGPSAEWGLDIAAQHRLWTFILDHPAAAAALLANGDRVRAGLRTRAVGSTTATTDALADIARALGLLDALRRQSRIARAAQARMIWDTAWGAISSATNLAPGSVGAGANASTSLLTHLADHWGIGPPAVDDIARDALDETDALSTLAAAGAVAGVFDALRLDRRVSSAVTLPPLPRRDVSRGIGIDYDAAFETWLRDERIGADERAELRAAKRAFSSPHAGADTWATTQFG